MDVRIDLRAYASKHEAIEGARANLEKRDLSGIDHSSQSRAMSAFVDRMREVSQLLEKYEGVLENDCWLLYQVSEGLESADRQLAADYAKSISSFHNARLTRVEDLPSVARKAKDNVVRSEPGKTVTAEI